MKQPRILILAGLALALAGSATLYRVYGNSNPKAARTSQGAGATAVPITTATATAEDFAIRRRTIGIMESLATVVVKSRIESQVTDQHVRDGQFVKKGELLFTLDDRDAKATIARDEAQLAKDQATLLRTRADLDRYERLMSTNAIPRQMLDHATADHKIAEATVQSDEAQLRADYLRLSYTRIDAPIDGRIGSIRVTPGNLITANDSTGLVTITQIHPISVAFTLAERDLAALRKASAAPTPTAVRVYTPGAAQPLATGELDFVDSAVDSASGTITAKAQFPNDHSELWPGMYVDIEIDLDMRPKTVMIPTVAIQTGQHGPFVFVARPDHKVETRKIEMLGTEGDRTALTSGVAAGEKLVVEGQMRLTDGAHVVEPSPVAQAASAGPSAAGHNRNVEARR